MTGTKRWKNHGRNHDENEEENHGKKGNNRNDRRTYGKYALCAVFSLALFLGSRLTSPDDAFVEAGILKRNPCGDGDALYEICVEGLTEQDFRKTEIQLIVPEQKLSEQQFHEKMPEMAELLLQRLAGDNTSLTEVHYDLNPVRELKEYGVEVSWISEHPEVIGSDGEIRGGTPEGCEVFLEAKITNGTAEEYLEIPVRVFPKEEPLEERFRRILEMAVLQEPAEAEIVLPAEYEGKQLRYRNMESARGSMFLILGIAAAACLYLKEKEDLLLKRKQREEGLMTEYPDFVYEYLILSGAGFSAKKAWEKMTEKYREIPGKQDGYLYRELWTTMNQLKTGTPEVRAYAEFGRRCGLQSYIRFATLLENRVSIGGKNFQTLLEAEAEEAFRMKMDMSRKKGEEIGTKLLLPMFGMLGVIMIMVTAPAFLAWN